MITGTKNDIAKLIPYVSPRLAQGLTYLLETDFSKVANGEYPLDGEKLFARVNTYETEPKAEKRPESHARYIDIQYLGEGCEKIWYCARTEKNVVTEDRSADDLFFYEDAAEKDVVTMEAGTFAIFFPWELHRPGCHAKHEGSRVQKIVVKVLAD